MIRYTLSRCDNPDCDAYLQPSPKGAWVKASDVERYDALLDALTEHCKAYRLMAGLRGYDTRHLVKLIAKVDKVRGNQ